MENQACFKMQKEKGKLGELEQQKTGLHKSSCAHVTADSNAGSNSFQLKVMLFNAHYRQWWRLGTPVYLQYL